MRLTTEELTKNQENKINQKILEMKRAIARSRYSILLSQATSISGGRNRKTSKPKRFDLWRTKKGERRSKTQILITGGNKRRN